MPVLESKFQTFHEFAVADLDDILGKEKVDDALKLEVTTFASCVLIQEENGFKKVDLPNTAQLSPIRDVLPVDINRDGNTDLVTVGNLYNAEVETVRYDAGMGLVLLGDGNGEFRPVLSGESGFHVMKDSRKVAAVQASDSKKVIVVNNNDVPLMFELLK